MSFTTLIQVCNAQQGNAHRDGLNLSREYSLALSNHVYHDPAFISKQERKGWPMSGLWKNYVQTQTM